MGDGQHQEYGVLVVVCGLRGTDTDLREVCASLLRQHYQKRHHARLGSAGSWALSNTWPSVGPLRASGERSALWAPEGQDALLSLLERNLERFRPGLRCRSPRPRPGS